MVATDGVYFTSKHPTLPISKDKLGLWEETEISGLTLMKPGVYWHDRTREQIRKGEARNSNHVGLMRRDSVRRFSR